MVHNNIRVNYLREICAAYACTATKPIESRKREKADAKRLFHHFSHEKHDILLTAVFFPPYTSLVQSRNCVCMKYIKWLCIVPLSPPTIAGCFCFVQIYEYICMLFSSCSMNLLPIEREREREIWVRESHILLNKFTRRFFTRIKLRCLCAINNTPIGSYCVFLLISFSWPGFCTIKIWRAHSSSQETA